MRVGSSVAQFARPPVLTALSALALAEYTQGRFVLGVGTGPLDWNKQWHGLEVTKPVARMREYIECLRTLWTATTPQPVSYSSEFIQVKDYVRFIPAAYDQVPIYLGGVNRHMIQLAGSHADRLILGGINTPKYITEVVHPNLQRGLQRAGRKRQDVELCMLKICAVNNDAMAARALARHAVAFTATLVYYDIVLDPMGFTEAARAIRAAMRRHDIPGMLSAVTDEMVAALTIAGRSYWIPGSEAPMLSKKCNAFLRLLQKKGFKEARVTRVRLDNLSTSTPLASNKSLRCLRAHRGQRGAPLHS